MRTAWIVLAVSVASAVGMNGPRAAAPAGPVLILAPHPDDETLGCGGLIARRLAEGRRVVVVVVTDGRALLQRFGIATNPTPEEVSAMRKEETRRAVTLLGGRGEEVRFLDFENERLVERQADAGARIAAILREVSPAELFIPSPFEGHAEHVLTHDLARTACAVTGACPEVFEFIVNLKPGVAIDSLPRRVVKIDVAAYRQRERRALAQFRSHLDVISPALPKPLDDNYDRYLTAEEPFLVPRDSPPLPPRVD